MFAHWSSPSRDLMLATIYSSLDHNRRDLSMKKPTTKKLRLKSLSLYPLKAEEALSLFMRVDPAKVEGGMRCMQPTRGKKAALPKG